MQKSIKLNWITSIKGLAALIVFVHHFFLFFYPAFCSGSLLNSKTFGAIEVKIAKTPFNILGWGGTFAVCIFYLISGFLIAYSFYVKNKGKCNVNDILKRYLTLMIPMFISSIIIYIYLKTGAFRSEQLLSKYITSGFHSYYTNFSCTFLSIIYDSIFGIFNSASAPINPPLWTMRFELLYSVLSMMVLFLFGKSKKRYIIYFFLIIFNLNTYMLAFTLGIIICDIYYNKKEWVDYINKFSFRVLVLLCALYFAGFSYISSSTSLYKLLNFETYIDKNVLFHIIGAALLLIYVLLSDFARKVLSFKWLQKIGDMSLSIYIIHWVIINTLSMYIVTKILPYTRYFVAVLISLVISTIVVIILSNIFEKRIRKFTKFINKFIFSKISLS